MKTVMVPKPKTEEATMGDQIEILLCLLVVLCYARVVRGGTDGTYVVCPCHPE